MPARARRACAAIVAAGAVGAASGVSTAQQRANRAPKISTPPERANSSPFERELMQVRQHSSTATWSAWGYLQNGLTGLDSKDRVQTAAGR